MQRPQSVTNAVLAIWASFGIFTLIAVIDRHTGAMTSGQFVGALFTYAILCVLPYKISTGKNWARYAYAISVALSVAMMLAGETKEVTRLALVMSYLTLPLQAWILFAIFRPESSEWFEAKAGN